MFCKTRPCDRYCTFWSSSSSFLGPFGIGCEESPSAVPILEAARGVVFSPRVDIGTIPPFLFSFLGLSEKFSLLDTIDLMIFHFFPLLSGRF